MIYISEEELCQLYTRAYHAGHFDTVEARYTDVSYSDYEYHRDAVEEFIGDRGMNDIVEHNGKKYEAVPIEDMSCEGCDFKSNGKCTALGVVDIQCWDSEGYVIFKEVKK